MQTFLYELYVVTNLSFLKVKIIIMLIIIIIIIALLLASREHVDVLCSQRYSTPDMMIVNFRQ